MNSMVWLSAPPQAQFAGISRQANNPQAISCRVKNPAPYWTGAVDSALHIHFHPIGDTVFRREHISKDPIIAQRPVGCYVESPDQLVATNFSSVLLFYATAVPPGDRNVQSKLVRRKSQAVGVLGLASSHGDRAVGRNAVNTAVVQLPFFRK